MVKDGGMVTAYDAKTGNEIYVQKRIGAPAAYRASPVAANGVIYLISQEGTATVIRAGANRLEVVAENPELGERVSATPAIADDTLYVRGEKNLYAFRESSK